MEAECPSSKGKLKAMIFNQSFYQKSLFKGKEYAYFGFYSKKRNQIYLSSVLALNNLLLQNTFTYSPRENASETFRSRSRM